MFLGENSTVWREDHSVPRPCVGMGSQQRAHSRRKSPSEHRRPAWPCGWIVQNASEMNISAGLGVAIREFPLRSGFADYLLYANSKAIGVLDAEWLGGAGR